MSGISSNGNKTQMPILNSTTKACPIKVCDLGIVSHTME